jgi:periplasmic protein TonB
MNRLQKKYLIATAGFHLLLIVILIVGPAFFYSKPKPDDSQVLDVIPAIAIEAALNSGVKAAQPPAPTLIVTPPQPVVTPPQVQPQPTPPPQPVTPAPSIVKQMEDFFKQTPMPNPDTKIVEKAEKPKPHEIKVNMDTVKRTAIKSSPSQTTSDTAQREQRQRADAIRNAVRNLKSNFTSATTVDMPGTSSVSYASYASIIKSIYTQAWTTPDNAANDEANTKVSVTVSSDGTVVESHIVGASGDSSVDASVQRTLDRVTFIAPFPDGSTEKEKTFIINFNLKAKRMLG